MRHGTLGKLVRVASVFVVVVLLPMVPAGALVAPFPGTVSEVQSEYGAARIAGTPDGSLIVARPTYGVIARDERILVRGVHPHLVAWDPATDDVIFTDTEGRVRRVHDGAVADVATGLLGITGVDVALDGTVYVAHVVERRPGVGTGVVSAISRDGERTVIAGGGGCDRACERRGTPALEASLDYLTGLTVGPNGDVIVFEDFGVDRIHDGVLRRIAGNGVFCSTPDPCGDEGPAIDARFAEVTAGDVGTDGSIYLTEHASARIRVIRPDGIVHNLVGSFQRCNKVARDDCLPSFGPRSPIQRVLSIALVGSHLLAIDASTDDRWIRLLQAYDVERAPAVAPTGYRMIAADGGVFTFGWSPFQGSTGDIRLVSPIVAGRSNGAGGYWFVAGDGGVFTFGDAGFFGSPAGSTTSPVVDLAVRPDGRGYTTIERDGRTRSFGQPSTILALDHFPPYAAIVNRGDGHVQPISERPPSLPRLNVPVVAAHSTKSGNGTWYVASDGGVFTDGDARFFGSTGAMRLNQPVLDLVPTPTEQGYWLVAADGGVFTFGDAEFMGSMGAWPINQPVVAGIAGPQGSG